jgi:hypothetical protein
VKLLNLLLLVLFFSLGFAVLVQASVWNDEQIEARANQIAVLKSKDIDENTKNLALFLLKLKNLNPQLKDVLMQDLQETVFGAYY